MDEKETFHEQTLGLIGRELVEISNFWVKTADDIQTFTRLVELYGINRIFLDEDERQRLLELTMDFRHKTGIGSHHATEIWLSLAGE